MEGAGLYASGYDHKVDWIMLKAICDFADGNKGKDKEERQKLAAHKAAQFVIESSMPPFWHKGRSSQQLLARPDLARTIGIMAIVRETITPPVLVRLDPRTQLRQAF